VKLPSPLVMIAAVTAVIITGCGSSGSGAGSSGSSQASGSGASIKVGTIGTYSGPLASSIAPGDKVMRAWASQVNAKGGINGRKIDLVVKDDGGNATTAVTAAKELINQDHVVAIVGEQSLLDTTWAPLAASAGIPVIGGEPFNLPFATNPDFFPSGANIFARSYATLAEGKRQGDKFAFLYCAEAPTCALSVNIFKSFAPSLNMQVALAQSVSASAPNYTAVCQALKESGAQSFEVGQASVTALRITDACVQQGVTATEVATAGITSSSWLSHPSTQGTLNIELDFPFFDKSLPATQEYQAFLQQAGLGDGNGATSTFAYVGAKLFEKAASSLGKTALTSDSLKNALYQMKNETLGGLTPPLTFTRGKATLINCWFLSRIKGNAWTAPQGLRTTCAPDDVIAPVAAAASK